MSPVIAKHLEYFLSRAQGLALPDSFTMFADTYLQALAKWNRVYNLTRIRNSCACLYRHVIEPLSLIPLCDQYSVGPSVLDVGTGAGIPGLMIAAARPSLSVSLVDASDKKVSFVRHVASSLQMTASCLHGRVESLQSRSYSCMVSRAFADLSTFFELTDHLRQPGSVDMLMITGIPNTSLLDNLRLRWGVVMKACYSEEELWSRITPDISSLFLSSEYRGSRHYIAIFGSEL